MAYKCKNCGRDVIVSYQRFNGGGALLMIHIESPEGKLRYVETCPDCGARLLIYDDLEWISPHSCIIPGMYM